MGCSPKEDSCYPNEDPAHGVTISAFELLETEVTEAQYEAVMKANPSCNHSGGGGPDNPVECVAWPQAKAFCEAIGGRLPTEAEWEYAARGGTRTRFYCGDDYACLDGIAWFEDNSGERKQPVGGKAPNAFGLYDMLGNVFEWTGDLYGEYSAEDQVDPRGPLTGNDRVFRGGSFYAYSPYGLRVSFRLKAKETYDDGHLGVRCAR
jgi:formylglycine-generating enzyme required for sulfatase activity